MTPTTHPNIKSIATDQLIDHLGWVSLDSIWFRQLTSDMMILSEEKPRNAAEIILLWLLTLKMETYAGACKQRADVVLMLVYYSTLSVVSYVNAAPTHIGAMVINYKIFVMYEFSWGYTCC